jgi:hypothetical protein
MIHTSDDLGMYIGWKMKWILRKCGRQENKGKESSGDVVKKLFESKRNRMDGWITMENVVIHFEHMYTIRQDDSKYT